MERQSTLEMEFVIHGFDCGYGGHLRPIALANMIQEAASIHAETLGVGAQAMQDRGLTWMLSRFDLRVEREPREGERLLARTWPVGFERLFVLRDFELAEAGGGAPIVRASYAYLVVDIASRKIVRGSDVIDQAMVVERPRAIGDARFRVEKPAGGWTESFAEMARERHRDHNQHVNNAHLVAWLCDAPPREERGSRGLKSLKVEFSQEVLPNDIVHALYAQLPANDGPRHAVELRRDEDVCARAEVEWAKE